MPADSPPSVHPQAYYLSTFLCYGMIALSVAIGIRQAFFQPVPPARMPWYESPVHAPVRP